MSQLMPRIFRPWRSDAGPNELPATEQQTPVHSPVTASQVTPEQSPVAGVELPVSSPSFGERARMRARMRFLRKARELAYRDLGGLVFDLHRFGQRNDALVMAKIGTLGHLDTELRALEGALGQHQRLTVLYEAGIAACPRCAAIHGSTDRFCPTCGLSMAADADRPIAVPLASPTPAAPSTPAQTPSVIQAPASRAPITQTTESAPQTPQTPQQPAVQGHSAPAPDISSQEHPTQVLDSTGANPQEAQPSDQSTRAFDPQTLSGRSGPTPQPPSGESGPA